MDAMSEKDIINRIEMIENQMTLVTQLRKEEFLKIWGHKGIEEFVNERLDEYLRLTQLLKELTDEDENLKSKEK